MDDKNKKCECGKCDEKIFSEFSATSKQEWKAAAEALLKGAPFDKKMLTKTVEGITFEPIYNKEDTSSLAEQNAFPGMGDYLRGTKVDGYLNESWNIAQIIDVSCPKEFNKVALDALNRGQTALDIQVCKCSFKVKNVEDMQTAFNGIALDKTPVYLRSCKPLAVASVYFETAKKLGFELSSLKGGICFDPLTTLARKGKLKYSLECAYEQMASLCAFNAKNASSFGAVAVDAYQYSNAGASAVQELGFALATGALYLKNMIAKGLDINEVAPLFNFRFSIGSNYFMEIAKFRAARVLWSKVVEAFGANDEARKIKQSAKTATYNKTKYDPYVNMLRTTTEAFSAVIGGVDNITVGTFDEIIRSSDEFSRRISRNQQIFLAEECDLRQVVDPSGGSWFIESLTEQLSKLAWEKFQEVEAQGGMEKAILNSFVKDDCQKTDAQRRSLINSRRNVIVGTNMYANAKEELIASDKQEKKTCCKTKGTSKCACSCSQEDVDQKTFDMNVLMQNAANNEGIMKLALQSITLGQAVEAPALVCKRLSEDFEALRDASTNFKNQTGKAPQIFLATMGPLVQHKIRADFVRGFFEVGGFDIIYPKGFNSADEAAQAFASSGAKYAVICSTDATYPELVAPTTKALKAAVADSQVFIAGVPAKENEEEYKNAGLDGSISVRTNNYEALKGILVSLGVIK